MEALLADRPAWYLVGPAIGLVLVGLFALLNARMGVLGGVTDLVERATGRRQAVGWKGWFVLGIVGGAVVFTLVGGPGPGAGYGWVTRELDAALVAPLLVLAGALIGYGAKHAGGCTSGNGLTGVSFGSPASVVAMATFMATAIVTTFAIEALA